MKLRTQILGRVLVVFACLTVANGLAQAQQRPLITEDVDIIPPGTVRIEAGVDFLQGAKYPASGLTGDLTRVGVLGISIGLAPNVEFQIEGVAQNFLKHKLARPVGLSLCRWRRAPIRPMTPATSSFGPSSNCGAKPGAAHHWVFVSACNCPTRIRPAASD